MSGAEPARARGATCRADLLRLLAAVPRIEDQQVALVLDVDATGWLCYERRPEPPPQPPTATGTVVKPSPKAEAAPKRKTPLRLPFLPAIVHREPRPPPERDPVTEQAFARAAPIDEAAARAPSDQRLIAFEDLVPSPRLLPALRRLLGATRFGPLDVDRMTELLAASQLPRRLPRRIFRRWHPDLIVLLDFCPRLWPYRWDMHQLAQRLSRQVGRSGVSLRIVNHGPHGPWSDWLAHQDRQAAEALPAEHDWRMPPAATPVLIVSDLGMLLGPQSAAAQAWAAFVTAMVRAQVRPLALVPLGAGQLGEPVPPSLPILRWSPDARSRPTRAHGMAASHPDGLDDLLAMVAATRRVDPPLLRAMRRLNPKAPLDAGLEGAVWCHPDVDAVHTASIRTPSREPHLRHFADRLKDLHAELDRQRAKHHAHLRAALNHEETLLWAAQVRDSPETAERIKGARDFMRRLVATLSEPGGSAQWWNVAQGIVQRADGRMWQRYGDDLHRLLAPQVRRQGAAAVIPEHADPAVLAGLLDTGRAATSCWLVQDAASGSLVLQGTPLGPRQSPLGEPLTLDAGGVRVSSAGRGPSRWLSAEALPARLAPLKEPIGLHLETARDSVLVAPVRRPQGARAWGCDRNGLFVRGASFGSWERRWSGHELHAASIAEVDAPARWALAADVAPHPDADGALGFGLEPRFGVFAELTIATEHGSATQRLRWIRPGTFVMGSPDDEPGRYDDEGPRHAVTISEGFWLFDTPCTQGLWQVVMGKNPSRFESPDRPVHQVSWDDVQGFLDRINGLVPGLDLALPSEAQWEYACRAGTETALYTGDIAILGENNAPALDPIAWYGGNSGVDFELANGIDSSAWSNKQYAHTRAGTRPVGLKQPNAWGLYDMLGNVWEWCADGQRTYTADAVTDPLGPMAAGGVRVLRGGSWHNLARFVRSACRDAYVPGPRLNYSGFRCARVQERREPGQRAGGLEKKKTSRGRSKAGDPPA